MKRRLTAMFLLAFADKIPLPREPANDRDDIPPVALTRTPDAEKFNDQQKKEAIRAYFACISFVDAQVGFVPDALDRLKLAGDTVVILFGDHGYHLGEHGLWRKLTAFEESARAVDRCRSG